MCLTECELEVYNKKNQNESRNFKNLQKIEICGENGEGEGGGLLFNV